MAGQLTDIPTEQAFKEFARPDNLQRTDDRSTARTARNAHNTLNIHDTLPTLRNISSFGMNAHLAKVVKMQMARRNIVLKFTTHDRLKKFLLELEVRREAPDLSMDDAVTALLDEHDRLHRTR